MIEQPPEQCPNCGAALQIHSGYNRPYRRHGWYVFGECETRWHPQHGLSISQLCRVRRDLLDARRERNEARKALLDAWEQARLRGVKLAMFVCLDTVEAMTAARAAEKGNP